MKQAAGFILFIFILSVIGSIAGQRVFSPAERALPISEHDEQVKLPGGDPKINSEEWVYKRTRLAFSSFDLAAGLSRSDLQTIPSNTGTSFYLIIACIWLVRLLPRPRKKS